MYYIRSFWDVCRIFLSDIYTLQENKGENMKKRIFIFAIFVCLLAAAMIPLAFQNGTVAFAETIQNESAPIKANGFGEYLTEYNSGKVLYSYNAEAKHEIASMVKIMTANLIFEAVDKGNLTFDEKITISPEAAAMGGSQMFLDSGAQYPVRDLIKGIIVVSANDASYAMAERIAGSVDAFVKMMNDKAKELGMQNTLFANCTGLPTDKEQYSCAKDVNIMTRQLMSHPEYFEYASIWMEDYTHPSGRVTQLVNTNKLLKQYSGCIGGKTGYTDKAGHCLSACAQRNDLKVVATIVGGTDSKSRFSQVRSMFDYAFANYVNKIYYHKGDNVGTVAVKKSPVKQIEVAIKDDIAFLSKTGSEQKDIELKLPGEIKAPVKKGDVIGKATYSFDGREYEVELIALQDAKKSSFWDILKGISSKW